MELTIREESPADIARIHELTRAAFAPMPFAGGNEQDLINALRDAGALSLSLVALADGGIAGHAAVSPAAHESGQDGWFALGPISVDPAWQNKGLGGALIARVKLWLAERRAQGCILTGNPRYYSKYGFVPAPEHAPDREPSAYFMIWMNGSEIPAGKFKFHPLFYV